MSFQQVMTMECPECGRPMNKSEDIATDDDVKRAECINVSPAPTDRTTKKCNRCGQFYVEMDG